jgi:hypothetical protein
VVLELDHDTRLALRAEVSRRRLSQIDSPKTAGKAASTPSPKRDKALLLLDEILGSGGWIPVETIYAAADHAGLARPSLLETARTLPIERHRTGSTSVWHWRGRSSSNGNGSGRASR